MFYSALRLLFDLQNITAASSQIYQKMVNHCKKADKINFRFGFFFLLKELLYYWAFVEFRVGNFQIKVYSLNNAFRDKTILKKSRLYKSLQLSDKSLEL